MAHFIVEAALSNQAPNNPNRLVPPHGGFRNLRSFQVAEIIYDGTVVFCNRFVSPVSRTRDQMVQAARSGRQNIAEGSRASGTSKKTEIKLVSVARASLDELLLDFEDYLRQHRLASWGKDDPSAKEVRAIGLRRDRSDRTDRTDQSDRSYSAYRCWIEESDAETAANTLICLIHQANYLLDRQLRALESDFQREGGFTERLYRSRKQYLSDRSTIPRNR